MNQCFLDMPRHLMSHDLAAPLTQNHKQTSDPNALVY